MKTFGKLAYAREDQVWAMLAPPHVVMRAKRVFERIDKRDHKILRLSDTPENCRELLWFCERFPLEVSAADKQRLEEQSAAHLRREQLVLEVLSADYVPPEFDLALPPRDYQRVAASLGLRSGHLLLADDLGLGKTVSAITMMADKSTLPALVVTLTHLPRQWMGEINRFAPKLAVQILKKGSFYDLTKTRGARGRFPDVIVTSYSKLPGWAGHLAGKVKLVVFDEAQELRRARTPNGRTAKYSAAEHVAHAGTHVLGMSATPVYNMGGEMFNVMHVIAPGALGSETEFTREWCGGTQRVDKAQVQDPKALGLYLRDQGLMLRRTRAEVKREIPPLQIIPHVIDADPAALEKVGARTAELARIILAQGGQTRGEKLRAAEEFSNLLRQATGIAKAPYVAEFVRMLVEQGERVVLYGWHRAVYDIWADALKDLQPAFYTGHESASQKEESKRRFIAGESKVLVISVRAGAGLDGLQHVCRTVVHGELDWSPGVHEQGDGRVYRDGQPDPVASYYLIAETGADPTMCDVLGLKKQQSGGVRDPKAELFETVPEESHVRRLAEAYLARRAA